MKLLPLLVVISAVGMMDRAVAMNIETGREFADNRDQRTGRLLDPANNLEQMPRISSCLDFVNQVTNESQELAKMIQEKQNMVKVMKFKSKADHERFIAEVTKEIKSRSKQLRILLDQVDKEASAAL